jgi:hypothetical protein
MPVPLDVLIASATLAACALAIALGLDVIRSRRELARLAAEQRAAAFERGNGVRP